MDDVKLEKLRKAESIVHDKKLYRNYEKCQFDSLSELDLAHVVIALIKASVDYKALFYVVFNNTVFYSDTVSLNSAYSRYFNYLGANYNYSTFLNDLNYLLRR